MKHKMLGKGLSDLLGQAKSPSSIEIINRINPVDIQGPRFYPQRVIDAAKLQDMIASIKSVGMLQPIIVNKLPVGYEIVSGYLRWMAAKNAQLETVPAIVKYLTDEQIIQYYLAENIHRQNMHFIWEAKLYKGLIDADKLSRSLLSSYTNRSEQYIDYLLKVACLPENLQREIEALHVPLESLIPCFEQEQPYLSIQQIVQTAKLKMPQDDDCKQLEATLSAKFGLQVQIKQDKSFGQIIFNYDDLEELDALLEKITLLK